MIKFLLKDKELTIKGVKKVLNSNFKKLDDYKSYSLKADYYKDRIKIKSKAVLERLKKLKQMAKKHILKLEWFQRAILIANLFIMQKNPQREKRQKIT